MILKTTRSLALLWTALAAATPAGAQQFHDVTAGPTVNFSAIAGGAFSPAGVSAVGIALSPQTAVAVSAAAVCVASRFEARALTSQITGQRLAPAAQEEVLRVVTGDRAPEALGRALAGGGAVREASALVGALSGLSLRPDPAELAVATTHFNELVAASAEEFLEEPSDEMLATRAILAQLGLTEGCVPLAAVDICVVTPENMLSAIRAYILPSGDTLVAGRPFREVHEPEQPQYAVTHAWFLQDLPIIYQGRGFVKSGEPRLLPRDALRRLGQHRGVPIFAEVTAAAPFTNLYLPVETGCEFQPYAAGTLGERAIGVCVVTPAGEIQTVEATFRPVTGDTLIAGRPFHEVHNADEPQYAAGHAWFVEDRPIAHEGAELVKFGARRALPTAQLRRVGDFQGVPIFVDDGAPTAQTVFYLPVGPDCEFQPYIPRTEIQIRG